MKTLRARALVPSLSSQVSQDTDEHHAMDPKKRGVSDHSLPGPEGPSETMVASSDNDPSITCEDGLGNPPLKSPVHLTQSPRSPVVT